jgi:RimJ/RimL family protein N-acetyltransferase
MPLEFKTSRLSVLEVFHDIDQSDLSELLVSLPKILSAPVVKDLPPYFQNIHSYSDAQKWFELMVSDSRLCIVKYNDLNSIIGFVFISMENDHDAHIGYLLSEIFWRQGLASELLSGLIETAVKDLKWNKLIGGVDKNNIASSNLLVKLGFVGQPSVDRQVVFYEYLLSKPKS